MASFSIHTSSDLSVVIFTACLCVESLKPDNQFAVNGCFPVSALQFFFNVKSVRLYSVIFPGVVC